jgi:uncharacterized protein YukE
MAVYRSPFSKPATQNTTPPSNPFVPNPDEGLDIDVLTSKIDSSTGLETKTSLYEEKEKLDNAYFTALGRIANSTASERSKEQLRRTLEVKYKQGGFQQPTDLREATSWKGLIKAAGQAAFSPVKVALEGSSYVSRGVQSGLKEIADLTYQVFDAADATRNPNGPKASWSDFTRQAKDKDFKMINTGVKWVDGIIDFAADVAFDPLTYAGVGAMNHVGKAGRMALTARLGTAEMLAKHPQLVGKLDDIMRYGVSAVPKSVRQAEDIKYGIRFAGQVLPRTEAIASVFSGNKAYSIATRTRVATGDLIAKSKKLSTARAALTPSSRAGLVARNIGRNKGISDNEVLQEVAHWTSTKYAKGYKSETYNKNLYAIRDTIKQIRELSDADQKMLYDLVENKTRAVPAHMRQIVDDYRNWQDQLRDEVNTIYRRFNVDFNGSMRDIGFVDDFIHHRITDDALRFIYSDRGQASGFFKDSDMTMTEIGGNTGAAMHRKIRAPEVMPDGTMKYSKFMGEDITDTSVVKQVNEIFRRKTGLDVDFFSTDLVQIADSYAYSMAAARGREAYFRRLFDYGGDFGKVITQKLVPDAQLVSQLQQSHNALMAIKQSLVTAVNKGRANVGKKTADVVKRVQTILDEKTAVIAKNANDIASVQTQIADLEVRLADAVRAAAAKGETERGAFYDLHKTLFDEVQQIKASIVNGEAVEAAAVEELRAIYLKMYPNAKRIPKSPTKLLDAINRGEGVADTVAYRELQKRLKALRSQLDNLPEVDADTLNEMLAIEKKLIEDIEGHEVIGRVMTEADYADDGLIYGMWDDLTERPFDPTFEGPSYRVMSTRPVVAGGDMTTDEMAAARAAFMGDERSVAVHAPRLDEVHDMREPERFYEFWDTDSGIGDAVGLALGRAGLDEDVWRQAWDDVLAGELDEMFDQVYPELSEVMGYIATMQASQHELGVVTDDFLEQSMDTFRELFGDVAAVAGLENSDMVAAQMMDDVLGYMAEQGAGKPLLIPSRIVMGMDNPMADGAYSLIVPENWSYVKRYSPEGLTGRTSSPVQFTKDNDFVRAIMDDDYHTAALNASESLASVTEATLEAQGNNLQRQVLRDELSPATRKAASLKGAGTRRMRQAEKAWTEWEQSGTLTITVGGKQQKVTRERALDILNKREATLNSKIAAKEAQIARMQGNATVKIEERLQGQRERLATLLNQKKVLERWDAKTGAYLRQELDDFRTVLAMEPPKGAPASDTRLWSDLVLRRMESIKKLGGTREHRALEAVFTQLHADEAQLAYYEAFQQISEDMLSRAQAGNWLPKAVDDIIDGWKVIEGMGIQMPPEMAERLLPNMRKLKNIATRNAFQRALMNYQNAFKIYATMSLGFSVRNAISATFMNATDGVAVAEMERGLKATIAYHKHGPNDWLDKLGIKDMTERALYEEAYRVVHATGRGVSDDFVAPTARGFSEKVMNNRVTRAFARANNFVEDSVRLPMALDTLRNGGTYDDAVYRISRIHFDYSDLSAIDETTKRYFVPFWVWTTRNIPLQVTQQLLRPSTYATYEKIRERHPVSEDVLMPKWLAEVGPIGLGGNTVLAPDLPQNRLATTAAGLVDPRRLIGQMNPLIKVPFEWMANKQMAMDIPFTDKFNEARGVDKLFAELGALTGTDMLGRKNAEGVTEVNPRVSYALANLLPPIGMAQRLSGGALGGKDTYAERANTSRLSWLGVPIREIGPRQQRGEAINRQFQIADLLKELARKGVIENDG